MSCELVYASIIYRQVMHLESLHEMHVVQAEVHAVKSCLVESTKQLGTLDCMMVQTMYVPRGVF